SVLNALNFLPSIYAGNPTFSNVKNVTVNSLPIEVGTMTPLIARPQDLWFGSARIDHAITSTDQLFYQLILDYRNQPLAAGNLAFGPRWGADQRIHAQNDDVN